METISKQQKEKEQLVFGAILAIATGFVVNLWSSIIYDLLFKGADIVTFTSPSISFLAVFTILIQAFFQFYLKDRYNDGPYTKTFWKRYLDFIVYEHWSGKMANKINSFISFIFKFFLWSIFIISATQSKAYSLLVSVLLFLVVKELYKKFKKEK